MLLDQFFHLKLQQRHGNLCGGEFTAADYFVLLHFLVGEHIEDLLFRM